MNNKDLVKKLTANGILKSPRIIKAFELVDRGMFVKPAHLTNAYEDTPLPIDSGQTISQPSVVAFMLELLNVTLEDKILDIGAGSGYTTALLTYLTGPKGTVWGVEIQRPLLQFGITNLNKYGFKNTHIVLAQKELGYTKHAPYDKILVSAESPDIPEELIKQLKVDGTMVIPVLNSIVKVIKTGEQTVTKEEYKGFAFVPLIKVTDINNNTNSNRIIDLYQESTTTH